jgi:hypothetical protein
LKGFQDPIIPLNPSKIPLNPNKIPLSPCPSGAPQTGTDRYRQVWQGFNRDFTGIKIPYDNKIPHPPLQIPEDPSRDFKVLSLTDFSLGFKDHGDCTEDSILITVFDPSNKWTPLLTKCPLWMFGKQCKVRQHRENVHKLFDFSTFLSQKAKKWES